MEKRNLFQKIFGKKKETNTDTETYTKFELLNGYDAIFTNITDNPYQSKVAREVIDRIATHCAKLVPKHIKDGGHVYGAINYLLEYEPNELMTKFDFLYRIVSQLYANSNSFIYMAKDRRGMITAFYPVIANEEKLLQDENNNIYLQFKFINQQTYTVPYSSLIHLRKFYNGHDIFRREVWSFTNRPAGSAHSKRRNKKRNHNCKFTKRNNQV